MQLSDSTTTHHLSRTVLMLLALFVVFSISSIAQNYPPFGSEVPLAQFDHGKRPQLTPPAPKLLSDGRTAQSAWNMELVGYDTLDGRSTYQPFVIRQGNRYIAYMAHHAGTAVNRLIHCDTTASPGCNVQTNGTSLLDVTDPAHPVYLAHIPGPGGSIDAAGNQMAHVCSGDVLPSNSSAEAARKRGHYYLLRTNGNTSGTANPGLESQEIYDVTDPSNPVLLTTVAAQLSNTHKNWWECDTGIAYLVANDTSLATPRPDLAPGWNQSGSNQHVKIYNLHDPANPEYIRDFGFVGQQPTVGSVVEGLVTPPTGIHGPISAGKERNRVYMAYGVGANGVIEIVDRNKLLTGCKLPTASANCATSPTEAEMLAPQLGYFSLPGLGLQGGHTSFPIFGQEDGRSRNILLMTSEEGGNECGAGSAPHAAWLYDITNEANAKQISVNPNDPALTRLDVPDGFDGTFHTVSNGLTGAAYSGCIQPVLRRRTIRPIPTASVIRAGVLARTPQVRCSIRHITAGWRSSPGLLAEYRFLIFAIRMMLDGLPISFQRLTTRVAVLRADPPPARVVLLQMPAGTVTW